MSATRTVAAARARGLAAHLGTDVHFPEAAAVAVAPLAAVFEGRIHEVSAEVQVGGFFAHFGGWGVVSLWGWGWGLGMLEVVVEWDGGWCVKYARRGKGDKAVNNRLVR
jgi:hypothetical protein